MGIPRLKRILEPHAKRTKITGRNAVVDGPAFAYHVYHSLKGNLKPSPFEQPSNELLGQTAVAWLDQIQACGLAVSAIYFDGFLPQAKGEERLKRLLKLSWDLRTYYDQCPAGIPKQQEPSRSALLWSSYSRGMPKKSPPVPPFMVPAVIEALRKSPKYGPLTQLKPGEADVFCAKRAAAHNEIIITSDSDLLVHDLGPDAGVIFFSDMDVDRESMTLTTLLFQPQSICKELKIRSDGLSRLAFELSLGHHITLEQAVENTRNHTGNWTDHGGHADFMEQYTSAEVVSDVMVDDDINLDPRISELALQCVLSSTAGKSRDGNMAMYLPFLLDSPLRTSAWEASRVIRRVAYGILYSRPDQPYRSLVLPVAEYRRLQVQSSGIQVELPQTCATLDQEASALLDAIRDSRAVLDNTPALWVVMSIHQDILSTLDQGKSRPLSLELLFYDALGKLDQSSWDFMHLLAQVQATYYSLRMIQQIIGFKQDRGSKLSKAVSQLGVALQALPRLSDFPTARDFASLLRSVREADGLSALAQLCSSSGDIIQQIEQIRNPEKQTPQVKKDKKRKNVFQGGNERAKAFSRNPFAVLEAE